MKILVIFVFRNFLCTHEDVICIFCVLILKVFRNVYLSQIRLINPFSIYWYFNSSQTTLPRWVFLLTKDVRLWGSYSYFQSYVRWFSSVEVTTLRLPFDSRTPLFCTLMCMFSRSPRGRKGNHHSYMGVPPPVQQGRVAPSLSSEDPNRHSESNRV